MKPTFIVLTLAVSVAAILSFQVEAMGVKSDAGSRSFLGDTARAMSTMDTGMMAKPSGNVDRDFVQMMVPHHQGAIDMAIAELRYGHDEQLKRIAQEIIVDQQQEIAAMRLALGQPLPASVAAPTQTAPHNHAGMYAGQDK
jgi:uncharacterized protein (DUF305 family)